MMVWHVTFQSGHFVSSARLSRGSFSLQRDGADAGTRIAAARFGHAWDLEVRFGNVVAKRAAIRETLPPKNGELFLECGLKCGQSNGPEFGRGTGLKGQWIFFERTEPAFA